MEEVQPDEVADAVNVIQELGTPSLDPPIEDQSKRDNSSSPMGRRYRKRKKMKSYMEVESEIDDEDHTKTKQAKETFAEWEEEVATEEDSYDPGSGYGSETSDEEDSIARKTIVQQLTRKAVTSRQPSRAPKLFRGELDLHQLVVFSDKEEKCNISEFSERLKHSMEAWLAAGMQTVSFYVAPDHAD